LLLPYHLDFIIGLARVSRLALCINAVLGRRIRGVSKSLLSAVNIVEADSTQSYGLKKYYLLSWFSLKLQFPVCEGEQLEGIYELVGYTSRLQAL
jgi:hypothetical protein